MLDSLLLVIPWLGVFGMAMATVNYVSMNRHSPGNEIMQKIAGRIHLGAMVFLKREYTIIAFFMVVVSIVLATVLAS